MRYISRVSALLFLALVFEADIAQAETFSADGMFDSVSVFAGKGANHNLRELPDKIISGSLDWDKSYFAALGFGKTRGTLGQSTESFRDTPFASVRHGYEAVLSKHFGMQNNSEVGVAYMLKTPDLHLLKLKINLGAGAGLSYALGYPAYEDGPDNDPARRYRLQLLALFDLEWGMTGLENLSVITRVHHRSGVYGLIAPRHVGSNFLTIGIRYRF